MVSPEELKGKLEPEAKNTTTCVADVALLAENQSQTPKSRHGKARKREALRELTKLTEEFGGYEELKGDNEETAR